MVIYKYNKVLIIPLGMIGITILAGAFLTLPNTNADDVVDQINITVPESCTVEPLVNPEHIKTVQNNQYYSEIGTTTFKTYCNDNNGYAIYAVGYSNDEIGNTLMKHNTSSSYDFNTGTATSGNTSNWAMKLSAVSGTYAPTIHSDANGTFSSYHVVPSEYTKVVSFASNTDLPATGVNADGSGFTSTYAAWISATQPAGTYIGKVLYQLVHPMTEIPLQPQTTQAGKICYYPNGSNVEGTMGCQTISTSATSATLLASNFSRQGYGFAGWSKTYDYSDFTGFLGPNETIAFAKGQYTGTNPGLSLYAIWKKSAGSIQGWTGCPSLASGAVTALTDQRDNETYAVAKLADDNCWMIENLRLESSAEHNSDGVLAQGYSEQFIGLADPETTDKFTEETYYANSLYSKDGSNGTLGIGTSDMPAFRMPRYNNVNTPSDSSDRPQSPTANNATNSTSNAGMYSYGNYYTWAAAVADTSGHRTDNQSVTNTSICPAGWYLPIGGSYENATNSDFWQLGLGIVGAAPSNNSYYQSDITIANSFRSYPNNFIYSGYVFPGAVNGRGMDGYYWSSTSNSLYRAYDFLVRYSEIYPGTHTNPNRWYKPFGWSIRCVASGD